MSVRHFYCGRAYELPEGDEGRETAYRAERAAFGRRFEAPMPDTSLGAVQLYVDGVTVSEVWARLKAEHGRGWDGPNSVRVESWVGPAAWAFENPARIKLPEQGRSVPIVLHELAHCLVGGAAGHRWPWALAYVELVRWFCGWGDAQRLEHELRAAGVLPGPAEKRQDSCAAG